MLVPPMVEEDMVAPKEVGMVRMAVEVVVEEAVLEAPEVVALEVEVQVLVQTFIILTFLNKTWSHLRKTFTLSIRYELIQVELG